MTCSQFDTSQSLIQFANFSLIAKFTIYRRIIQHFVCSSPIVDNIKSASDKNIKITDPNPQINSDNNVFFFFREVIIIIIFIVYGFMESIGSDRITGTSKAKQTKN